jgi:hypothetical protein
MVQQTEESLLAETEPTHKILVSLHHNLLGLETKKRYSSAQFLQLSCVILLLHQDQVVSMIDTTSLA